VLFRRSRLSVSSNQGDVMLYYPPSWDGEVLMGKAGAPSRIYSFKGYGVVVALCSLDYCCSGEDAIRLISAFASLRNCGARTMRGSLRWH
jgi:hypothetical protein